MTPTIPAAPEAIDATWLEQALAPRHPGVRVRDVQLAERHEVTNCHARLDLTYDEDAGAPARLFCKLPPTDPARRAAIAQTGMGRREARFYDGVADLLALRTPRVHAAAHDEDGGFVLLLEDLADSGCEVPDGTRGIRPDAAARALEDLAAMHVAYEDPVRRRAAIPWLRPPDPPSDYGSSRLQVGLDDHRDRLTPTFAALAELYIARQTELHTRWHREPLTLIHGDAHLGNLFLDAGRVGFLDWGILQETTPLRDVAYFLCMALDVEDRRTHERDLWKHYLEVRNASSSAPLGFDAAWREHRVQASYLVPACCQIVTFPDGVSARRQRFADAFLARAEAALDDLEVADALRAEGL